MFVLCFCFVHFINLDFFVCFCNGDVGLQLLMLREDFCLSGGQFSGTYSLPGRTRSTRKLPRLILRLVVTCKNHVVFSVFRLLLVC